MQVSRINCQNAVMNNRQSTQSRKSDVSFGILCSDFEYSFKSILEKSSINTVKSIRSEDLEYLRKHPVLFKIKDIHFPALVGKGILSKQAEVVVAASPIEDNRWNALLVDYKQTGFNPKKIMKKCLALAKRFDRMSKAPKKMLTDEMALELASLRKQVPVLEEELRGNLLVNLSKEPKDNFQDSVSTVNDRLKFKAKEKELKADKKRLEALEFFASHDSRTKDKHNRKIGKKLFPYEYADDYTPIYAYKKVYKIAGFAEKIYRDSPDF